MKIKLRSSIADVCNQLPFFYAGDLTKTKPRIVIVLDPVISDDEVRYPIKQQHLDIFKRLFKINGIDRHDVCFVGAAPACTFEVWDKEKLLAEHLKPHRDSLKAIFTALKPSVIVCAGKSAARQVFGRAVKITTVRGLADRSNEHNTTVLPILSPLHVARRPELNDIFAADIATLGRLKSNGYDVNSVVPVFEKDYRWSTDISHLLDGVKRYVAVDVETTGGNWYDKGSKILTVQICTEPGKAIILPIDYDMKATVPCTKGFRNSIVQQLKKFLENPNTRCLGHNFKYDFMFLETKLGIRVANYAHDTLLLAHALDENMLSKSLDDCVRTYVPEMSGFNDVYNRDPQHQKKSRMDLFAPEKMKIYGCGDVDASLRLFRVLFAQIKKDDKLYNCYRRVVMPAMRAFCDIEKEGFTIDVQALKDFEKELSAVQLDAETRLLKQIPTAIRIEYQDSGVGLKLSRAALLRALLFTHPNGLRLKPRLYTKSKEPSVSTKNHLPYFIENPFVAELIDYLKNDKLLNTYVKGFYKYIKNGKIHPSYNLHKTVTGRSASENPNGQNFPKRGKLAKKYRRIFVAPKGWKLIEADYSQIELRIVAIMAKEAAMLAVYKAGGDIHEATAAKVMNIPLERFRELAEDLREQKRFQAKAVNFGFIYGMWWKKFKIYAKTDYGIEFTDKEAEMIRVRFFAAYQRLEAWQNAMSQYALKNGYVRAIDGRVRHLPMVRSSEESIVKQAMRQAINSPVQVFASDLGLMALARINNEADVNKVRLLGFIHDALVGMVKDEYAVEGCNLVKRYMESNPLKEWFDFSPPIPIVADIAIGRNLAEMYKVKPSALNDPAIRTSDQLFAVVAPKQAATDLLRMKRKIKLIRD